MSETGAAPVPVRLMVKGLPAPLKVAVMLPVCVPVAFGVKVTLILQLAPAATDAQVLVSANSVELVATATVTGRAVVELLVSVIFLAALVAPSAVEAKVSEVVESVTTASPVPVRLTVCVAGDALSAITKLPVYVWIAVGAKVILILQDPPAATELPQVVLVSAKGALGGVMLEIASAVVVLVLLRVTLNVVLVLPTATEWKL